MPISDLLKKVYADVLSNTTRGRLVRSAFSTSAMRAASAGVAFLASLLYARTLGPHGYGIYAYVIAWTNVLAIPVALGIPQYLVREGARYPDTLFALRRWADGRVFIAGVAAAIGMASVAFFPTVADARWLFVIAAPLPFITAVGSIRSGLLQAQGRIATSQWPRLILMPTAILGTLILLWLWHGSLTPTTLIIVTTMGALIPLIANSAQLRANALAAASQRITQPSLRAAIPFMLTAGLFLINSRLDLIMLGAMKGAHAAGIYAVASRAAEITSFSMATVNMVLAPKVAELHHRGERALVQRMIRESSTKVFLMAAPIAVILGVGAKTLLSSFYGADYASGSTSLQILVLAQILVVGSGPLGMLLNMTGHTKINTQNMLYAVALNFVLNAALIPAFGASGAAAATCLSLVFSRLLLWRQVHNRLGI